MKKQLVRSCAPWLVILTLVLLAAPASAQVPQDTTFTGRLVDDLGSPLAGPVDLILRIFDADTGGNNLYKEQHLDVPLDTTGGFSVQLGLGTSPSGPFDADLFSGVNRWLQVEVGTEVLTPRQMIGSVPWALIAQQANEIVPNPNAPRFEDCSDGTVADHQTGLLWEKKTGTVGNLVDCETVVCSDPHEVNNVYQWSNTGSDPDGRAFTDFLARLNGEHSPASAAGCFADHCDWELPKISELQMIMVGPDAAPGQGMTCSTAPCIDPGFAAVGGPTGPSQFFSYWSASSITGGPSPAAWSADFNLGEVRLSPRSFTYYVRAIRTGSCN